MTRGARFALEMGWRRRYRRMEARSRFRVPLGSLRFTVTRELMDKLCPRPFAFSAMAQLALNDPNAPRLSDIRAWERCQ